jgi:hypothetical protein
MFAFFFFFRICDTFHVGKYFETSRLALLVGILYSNLIPASFPLPLPISALRQIALIISALWIVCALMATFTTPAIPEVPVSKHNVSPSSTPVSATSSPTSSFLSDDDKKGK